MVLLGHNELHVITEIRSASGNQTYMAWFIKSEIDLITIYIGIADDIQNK